jgi:uncharacterized protein (TIGR03435 family)
MTVVFIAILLGLVQTAPAQRYEFEVASVKLGDESNRGGIGVLPTGRFKATDVSLRQLLRFAYDVRDFQISGGPDWLDSARFTIEAKAPAGVEMPKTINDPQVDRFMVQTLLADRFKLEIHRSTREEQVYELVPGKDGAKLKVSAITAGQLVFDRGKIVGVGVPMRFLVNQLSQQLGRMVIDRTGLTQKYEFELNWMPDFDAPGGDVENTPAGNSIFAAVQDDLGLKLQTTKAPTDVIVIDQVEKPTPN